MQIIGRHITHNAVTTTDGAGDNGFIGFLSVGNADFALIMASCDAGTTSCVFSFELADGEPTMTNSPFIDVDESFPADPTAGLHTVLTGRQLWRLLDIRGIDSMRVRLNTRTGGDETFSCLVKLLKEKNS